jgi:hypothetical protein
MSRGFLLGVLGVWCVGAGVAIGCGSGEGDTPAIPDAGKQDATPPVDAAPDAKKDASGGDGSVKDGSGDGSDGAVFVWPDCLTQPVTSQTRTIPQVWADNAVAPKETWISGVYVTAVSRGACTANQACQIFLQQDLTYANLAQGALHGIKMFISAAAAQYFTTIAVGDKVDALGWAWRYTLGGQNELLVEVNSVLPGCAHKTSTGTPTPVSGVFLSDLSVNAYENTVGPLLIKVNGLIGTPGTPTETFGLGTVGFDGGADAGSAIVSLSPFFLPGGAFTGLTNGQKKTFSSVTGVFGHFVPPTDASAQKFLEIYPRTMSDVP